LVDLLRDRLADLPGLEMHDLGQERCEIVMFTKEGETASALHKRLVAQGINMLVSSARSARHDMGPCGLHELARASVNCFNTEEEIDRFCETLVEN